MKHIHIVKLAPGGCTLQKHLQNKDETDVIKQGCWDDVVIQESSAAPARPTWDVMRETYPYAHSLDSLVHRYNKKSKVIFYMTWGHKDGWRQTVRTMCGRDNGWRP